MSEFLKRLQGMPASRLALLANELQIQLERARESATDAVAIIGMAGRYPGGCDTLEMFWRMLAEGRDAIEDMPRGRWDMDGLYDPDPDASGKIVTRRGSFLRDFDHFDAEFFGIPAREAETIDPQHRLLLEVAWEALEDAGQSPGKRKGTSTGVFVGICTNDFVEILTQSKTAWDGYLAQGTAHSIAAGRLSYVFGFEGPCMAVDTACSSSLVATHLACRSLLSGECGLALAGGVSVLLSPIVSIDFSRARILSPSGLCRPFDAAADGYVRGEGCGVFVLKRLSDALRDGDHIRAVIRGSAVNHGGRSSGLLAPKGSAQEAVINAALAAARVAPSEIAYLEASSVGTLLGDPIEIETLRRTLCRDRGEDSPLVVGSVKTNIGHLEGASGAAALAKVVLSLERGAIPSHLHFDKPNPHVEWRGLPIRIPREAVPWPAGASPRLAAVSSFGLSGSNAHLILEEAPPRVAQPREAGRAMVLPLSARTDKALERLAALFAERIEAASDEEFPAICYTAATGRVHHPRRWAIVAASRDEALRHLTSRHIPATTEIRRHATSPRVAFLFPGRGDVRGEVMRERCESLLRLSGDPGAGEPLAGSESSILDPELRLPSDLSPDTTWFCAQYALARMWRKWGVEPAFVLGEDGGEYAAACVAGLFGLADGLGLVRGLSELRRGSDDHGPSGQAGAGRIASFRQTLSTVSFQPVQVRIVSGLSGRRTALGDLADQDYWIRQMEGPGRYRDGVGELKRLGVEMLVIMGFEDAAAPFPEGVRVLASLSSGEVLDRSLAEGLSALYTSGVDIDWDAVHEGRHGGRVSLPTYPFERRRFWPAHATMNRSAVGVASSAPAPPVVDAGDRAASVRLFEASGSRDERIRIASRVIREELAGILGLQPEGIDCDASLVDLGLDSIRALQLKDRLSSILKTELPVAHFVASPSVTLLAEFVAEQSAETRIASVLPEIVPNRDSRYEPFPLTDIQQAYWVGRNSGLDLGGVSTHAYFEYEVAGLDIPRLEWAVRQVVERHDMLRATVLPDGRQLVAREVPDYRIETADLRGCGAEERQAALERIRGRMSHEVRPADRWPLFEVRASMLAGNVTRLHLSVDMLIVDAWSIQILAREIGRLYESPESPLPELTVNFRDYVLARTDLERTGTYQRSRQYWMDRIEKLPPAPELPLVKEAGSAGSPRFVRRTARIDRKDWAEIQARSRKAGVSPTVGVLAAFAHVLRGWARSPHFTINLTLFHRPPLHPQMNEIVGDFTSLTLLEADLRGEAAFEMRARAMQQQLWADLDHRYFGGVRVLREMAVRQGRPFEAIMPVVFTAALGVRTSAGEISESILKGDLIYAISQTPQVWLDHQVFEDDEGLILIWDAVENLFPPGALDDMFAAYQGLLERLAREDDAWDEPVGPLTPAGQVERRRAVNAVEAPLSTELLHTRFLEQAGSNPGRPAVIAGERSIDYAELGRRSGALACRLRELGAVPNQVIGIVMEKGWEQIVAALGILESGAAYLPVDAHTPQARLDYLLEQCSVPIVLTQERFRETVRWPACVRTILCDFPDPDDPPKPLSPAQGPDDLAYVIFTSGSSGLPKGVEIDHRGAVNTIVDVNRRFGIGPGDRVLALSSLSFDLSVYDVFGLLAAGGTVVVPGAADVRDAARWLQLLEEHQVTVWNSVPALMQILCEYAASHSRALPASLRLVLLSGDWIPVGLPGAIRSLSERGQGLAVVSLGGATEASIWSIFHPVDVVDPSWPSIPYGRPLGNQAMHVLDGEFWPRPDWVAGDLYIEGVGLARGYRGDAERTSAAFVENPRTRRRLYRTGDLARYRPDGTMEFLGRADSQVKIQGYRVEPGEIEANLRQHAGVRHAMAFVVGEPQHEKRLVAAVVGNADQAPSPEALREFLAASLPDYMVPSLLLVLDAFPLTGNGKVDMRALAGMASDPGREAVAASGPSDASDPFTQKLIQLVKTELQLQDLDADTNLLNLGANSLDMLRLVNEIELHLGFRPRIEEFFRRPTITGLRELRRRFEASDQAAPAGPAGPATPSEEASDLVLDPRERDALKRRSLEVRQFEAGRARVPLHVVSTDGLEPGVFAARRTHREFDPRPVALEALSSTLGCLSGAWVAGRGGHRYASAGGLYPVQTYLHVKEGRVEGIPQGTYYYDPLGQDLVLLRGGVAIEAGTHAPQNQPIHIASAFTIFLVAETEFLKALYGDLSIHLATLEAGLMTELLDLTGPRHGIGLCQIGAIRFDGIREFFDLKDSHVLVHTVLGGRIPGSASGPAGPDGREEGTV